MKETTWMHPFNTEGMKVRLLEEYRKYGQLIVGLDFDNTVYDTNNTEFNPEPIIDLIRRAQKIGCVICLWTLELDPDKLSWKYNYLNDREINIRYINDSPLLSGCKKPFFNILLDDRAGLESAYESLLYVVENVETEFSEL